MKLEISLPRVFCRRQQGVTGIYKDDIYVVVIAGAAKAENSDLFPAGDKLVTKLFQIKKFAKNTEQSWNEVFEFDLGDAQAFAVTIALYEADGKATYNDYQSGLKAIAPQKAFDWIGAIKQAYDIRNLIPTSTNATLESAIAIAKILSSGYKLYKEVQKFLKNDDLLGQQLAYGAVEEAIYNSPAGAPREFNFKNWDYSYDVNVNLKIKN
jgi:hypothetical protein